MTTKLPIEEFSDLEQKTAAQNFGMQDSLDKVAMSFLRELLGFALRWTKFSSASITGEISSLGVRAKTTIEGRKVYLRHDGDTIGVFVDGKRRGSVPSGSPMHKGADYIRRSLYDAGLKA
jgi:hypothetical protein